MQACLQRSLFPQLPGNHVDLCCTAGFMEKSVCIQTLAGHSGTITALVHKGQFVLSSSTDCTVRLWKAAPGRGMMAHPWFVEQVCCLLCSTHGCHTEMLPTTLAAAADPTTRAASTSGQQALAAGSVPSPSCKVW